MCVDEFSGKEKINEILHSFPQDERYLLPVLLEAQSAFRYLPRGLMNDVASYFNVPLSRIYAMATFYNALSLTPKGKIPIKVCMGTACHLRGASEVLARIEECLGIGSGQTTEDGLFSLETVNCLGACALAPVVVIGVRTHGKVTPGGIEELLEKEKDHVSPVS